MSWFPPVQRKGGLKTTCRFRDKNCGSDGLSLRRIIQLARVNPSSSRGLRVSLVSIS
ncbi:MAG: hypothetical protein CM1200mP20_10050 [Pseudomonadota bacterium]|nr:MAG: hypothetical protein CM1200mP20_10050 [Pseudomonadota bacterium]